MNPRIGAAVGAAVLVATAAGPLGAQTYDVPSFRSPYGESGYGLYFISQNDADDPGALLTWRTSGAAVDAGLRFGVLDVRGDAGLFGGVELRDRLVRASPDFPLDVAWVSGAGVGTVPDADFTVLRVPFGVSLGRSVHLEDGTVFIPYAHPRLALDAFFFDPPGPGGDDSDTELNFDLDLGFDFDFGGDLTLRFGVTLGENDALGVGVAF